MSAEKELQQKKEIDKLVEKYYAPRFWNGVSLFLIALALLCLICAVVWSFVNIARLSSSSGSTSIRSVEWILIGVLFIGGLLVGAGGLIIRAQHEVPIKCFTPAFLRSAPENQAVCANTRQWQQIQREYAALEMTQLQK